MTASETMRTSNADTDMLDVRTSSYASAFFWAALFNAILMYFKESFEAVHNAMAAVGHHWVTHGVLDLIVFFGLAMLLTARGHRISGSAAVKYLVGGVIVGGGLIVGFFLLELI